MCPLGARLPVKVVYGLSRVESQFYIDGLVQYCSISSASAMEVVQPCTKQSTCSASDNLCWFNVGVDPIHVVGPVYNFTSQAPFTQGCGLRATFQRPEKWSGRSVVAQTQKVLFLCNCCSTTLVHRSNWCTMFATYNSTRFLRGDQWPTPVHPFCDHGDAWAFLLPLLSDMWATDLFGDLCATVLNMLKTSLRPWRGLNVLRATLERPRQPFGFLCAFNGDLASYVVADKGGTKAHVPLDELFGIGVITAFRHSDGMIPFKGQPFTKGNIIKDTFSFFRISFESDQRRRIFRSWDFVALKLPILQEWRGR